MRLLLVSFLSWVMFIPLSHAGIPVQTATPHENSLTDHQAQVFHQEGNNRVLHRGEQSWIKLNAGDPIREGSQIITGQNATVQIVFDDFHANQIQILSNTMAEFRTIEPTDIDLSDGTIFNLIEGLSTDSLYTISTPTSVAAVRGTAFLRSFDAAEGKDETQVSDGKLDIAPFKPDGMIDWDQSIAVQKNQAFLFHQKDLETGRPFQNFKPIEMTPKQIAYLLDLQQPLSKQIIRFKDKRDPVSQQMQSEALSGLEDRLLGHQGGQGAPGIQPPGQVGGGLTFRGKKRDESPSDSSDQ